MANINDLVKTALDMRMDLMSRNNRIGVAFNADAELNLVTLEVCDKTCRGYDLRIVEYIFRLAKDGEIIITQHNHL